MAHDIHRSLTTSALDVGVSEIAGQTLAGHCAERQGIDDQTLSVDTARSDDRTGIDAFAVEASVLAGTFRVRGTTALDDRLFCKKKKKKKTTSRQ